MLARGLPGFPAPFPFFFFSPRYSLLTKPRDRGVYLPYLFAMFFFKKTYALPAGLSEGLSRRSVNRVGGYPAHILPRCDRRRARWLLLPSPPTMKRLHPIWYRGEVSRDISRGVSWLTLEQKGINGAYGNIRVIAKERVLSGSQPQGASGLY
jgi:hypothetical protein